MDRRSYISLLAFSGPSFPYYLPGHAALGTRLGSLRSLWIHLPDTLAYQFPPFPYFCSHGGFLFLLDLNITRLSGYIKRFTEIYLFAFNLTRLTCAFTGSPRLVCAVDCGPSDKYLVRVCQPSPPRPHKSQIVNDGESPRLTYSTSKPSQAI